MPAYAIAHLQDAAPHPEIAEYVERLPATFETYGGSFLVHFMPHEVKEGAWPGSVVVLGFPGIAEARAWWDSPEYQEIAPLRSAHRGRHHPGRGRPRRLRPGRLRQGGAGRAASRVAAGAEPQALARDLCHTCEVPRETPRAGRRKILRPALGRWSGRRESNPRS